jgi:hypothetical protein
MNLEPNGAITLLRSDAYANIDPLQLRIWCHANARYGLPTVELIEWLRELIGGRTAIEIGSGCGDLCHHLGIAGYDNMQQTWPDVRLHYAMLRQPTIRYGSWVKEADALDAVKEHRPQVVIGSWVTHWIDPDLPMPLGGGNMYGVREDEILPLVETYIVIGNLDAHGHKPILQLPHEEFRFPWLRSRAGNPTHNRIFVWGKR